MIQHIAIKLIMNLADQQSPYFITHFFQRMVTKAQFLMKNSQSQRELKKTHYEATELTIKPSNGKPNQL